MSKYLTGESTHTGTHLPLSLTLKLKKSDENQLHFNFLLKMILQHTHKSVNVAR